MKSKGSLVTIEWREANLDEVIRFFADKYAVRGSGKILNYEYTVDVFKRRIAFKMVVERPVKVPK